MAFQQIFGAPDHLIGQGNDLILPAGMAINEQSQFAGRSFLEQTLTRAAHDAREDLNRRNLSDDDMPRPG